MRLQFLPLGLIAVLAAPCAAQSLPLLHLVSVPDDQLGSTMTLDQLQKGTSATEIRERGPVYSVQPAGEVVPALKYKLYPAKWELKSGSALLHLNRAFIHWLQVPREQRGQWQSSEWLDGSGDGAKPSQQEIEEVVRRLDFLFRELHDLALSEDFQWDHRLRNVTGPDVYTYLLPDIQEVRALARMLSLRIRVQLANGEFDGAISSIADGIRLSEFVGQGETLIQKLVGIAIQGMMREQLTKLISTPGCPNLYWAIATIPRPLNQVSDSVMWELGNVSRVLPVLAEAENETWSQEGAMNRWKSAIQDLEVLSGSTGTNMTAARTAIAIIGATQVDQARRQLVANGLDQQLADQMPGLQAVLRQTAQELRVLGDDVGKAHLLPSLQARLIAEREQKSFDDYIRKNRSSSLSAIIAGLLYPAVRQAAEAEVRMEMGYHRLMTLEALRMYVSENNKLPESLDQLTSAPAFPDPYTGEQFEYIVDGSDLGPVVTLKAAGPANYPPLMEVRVRFESLK